MLLPAGLWRVLLLMGLRKAACMLSLQQSLLMHPMHWRATLLGHSVMEFSGASWVFYRRY
jgi:hypothetical protein